MFYCRNIEIWCTLLSLLRISDQHVLPEDNAGPHNVLIPYNSKEQQLLNHGSYDYQEYGNEYYSKEMIPNEREEREIQEYENYREEKDIQNLNKGGLGLFSWWKKEPDAKQNKTNAAATNNSTNDIGNLTGNWNYPPFNGVTINGSPTKIDLPLSYSVRESIFNNSSSLGKITDTIQLNGTTTWEGNLAGYNTATTTVFKFAASIIPFNLTGPAPHANQSLTATKPSLLNGDEIIQLFQLPNMPVTMLTTSPPTPYYKFSNEINYNKETLKDNSTVDNFNENLSNENYSSYGDKLYSKINVEDSTLKLSQKPETEHLWKPAENTSEKYDAVEASVSENNKTLSNLHLLNYKSTLFNIGPSFSVLNHLGDKNKLNSLLKENNSSYVNKPGVDLNKRLENDFEDNIKTFYPKKDFIRNFVQNNFNEPSSVSEILVTPSMKLRRDVTSVNPEINSLNFNSSHFSDTRQSLNSTSLDIIESILHGREGYPNGCKQYVKYNDTYLLQNSNDSINLLSLCKNVTCKGNDYLTQCCSRECLPCKGENISFLKPIPGDTTTTLATYMTGLNRGNRDIANNENIEVKNYGNLKQFNRVVRENDLNDFVKFQLMHGMTAPDGKELINALKEANVQIQKVNREFHPNEIGITDKADRNSQSNLQFSRVNKHELSEKDHGRIIPPLNTYRILEELRGTLSNSLLHENLGPNSIQRDRYRIIRNQEFYDQMENIRKNSMILEKLKKETELELKRLSLLEMRRREEEELFNIERQNGLSELKTIQELIHKELETRTQSDPEKRAASDTPQSIIVHPDLTNIRKENSYSKLVRTIENSVKNNDVDDLILKRYSATESSKTSKHNKSNLSAIDFEKFPELEIKSSAYNPHDNTLFVLNLEPDNDSVRNKERKI